MSDVLGPASLALGQGIGAFQFFLPRLSEVRRSSPGDPDMAGDVRMGEIAAIAVCTAVGAIGSSLARSVVPMVVSMVTSFVIVCVYEAALQGDKPFNGPKGLTAHDATS